MKNLKEQIDNYISENIKAGNRMRKTHERNLLIEKASSMEDFKVKDLLTYAESEKISKPSVYFFIELLVKIGVVKIQERYVWNNEIENESITGIKVGSRKNHFYYDSGPKE